MTRYVLLLIAYIPFYVLAMLLAPVLPLFAEWRDGPADNANATAVEPRLPRWLFWFDTSYDNSLWGDHGWRTKHCPDHWRDYWGMVLWLWRNPACGFCWSVLAHEVDLSETFTLAHSGSGLDVDKGKGKMGWYFIRSSGGAFSLRWCKAIWFGKCLSFECGWLLDVYLKDKSAIDRQPRAPFQFQPQMRTLASS